jgi:hypothetical protein
MSAALGYVFMLCSVLFRGSYGVGYKAIAGSPPAWVFNRWILLFAAVTYSAFGPFCNVLAGHPQHCSVNFSPYGFVSGLSNTCAMLVRRRHGWQSRSVGTASPARSCVPQPPHRNARPSAAPPAPEALASHSRIHVRTRTPHSRPTPMHAPQPHTRSALAQSHVHTRNPHSSTAPTHTHATRSALAQSHVHTRTPRSRPTPMHAHRPHPHPRPHALPAHPPPHPLPPLPAVCRWRSRRFAVWAWP